jgi:methylase of polypeptide subunit release factors
VAVASSAPALARIARRAVGAYYTPTIAAEHLVRFAVLGAGDRVLEPSMGDGAFLDALERESARRGVVLEVHAVELASDTYAGTVAHGVAPTHLLHADFLSVEPFPVDAVVGNPPFVRLRHLPPEQSDAARRVTRAVLGGAAVDRSSVWMPFVLHATRFLVPGGRLAFVVPFDATFVDYARPLWKLLGAGFGRVTVIRVRERLFPDTLQDVVLLLADGFGGTTPHVELRAYATGRDLLADRPRVTARVAVERVVRGDRAFLEALVPGWDSVLPPEPSRSLVAARELVTFRIGYVAGDKAFFHPDDVTVASYGLGRGTLRPALTSSRALRGAGLRTSNLVPPPERLFLPTGDPAGLGPGEQRYVTDGVRAGVAGRYKCRTRDPWYVTPYVRVPDVVLPVFTERPAMIVNDAGLVVSNSLLCGALRPGSTRAVVTAWYTSLTLLELELRVHSLGGGVMVLVPREAGHVRLARTPDLGERHLDEIDRRLRAERYDDAFAVGDDAVLGCRLGLSIADVDRLRAASAELAWWRTGSRGPRVSADVPQPVV